MSRAHSGHVMSKLVEDAAKLITGLEVAAVLNFELLVERVELLQEQELVLGGVTVAALVLLLVLYYQPLISRLQREVCNIRSMILVIPNDVLLESSALVGVLTRELNTVNGMKG